LDVCESRDPKGHYRKARAGDLLEFTGISAPYEAPEAADLVIETNKETVEESLDRLLNYVSARL
jgi:adenylylsulfate kinase-like enzyme